jgi:hypothetical protein
MGRQRSERLWFVASLGKQFVRPSFRKKKHNIGLVEWLKWKSTCLASVSPSFSPCSEKKCTKNWNSKTNYIKYSYTWRVTSTLLNYQWVIKEIRRDSKKFQESNENENKPPYRMQQRQEKA